ETRWLRLPSPEDAVREVEELGRELVALREGPGRRVPADSQVVDQLTGILIGGVHAEASLRAHDLVVAHVGGAEAAGDRGQALPREAQHEAGHLVDLAETGVVAARAPREQL